MKSIVGIALLGCGTVGATVAEALHCMREHIALRAGIDYDLRGIAIRDPRKARPKSLEARLFSRDARAIVDDPQVDVVVELIGGTGDAAECVERALYRGCHVVTANKDLLATHGPRLFALAASRGAALRFEGAIGGAIPIVQTLSSSLAAEEVHSVAGIVNGSCTSILSAMEAGAGYHEALAYAQALGYAEADPANDVEGIDAAHKLALLAQLAFGVALVSPRIRRTGITAVSQRDVARAQMLGLRIRLIAAAARADGGVAAEVAPLLVPEDHAFGRASGPQNVVQIHARDAGKLELHGTGAGGVATRSAVLADILSVLRGLASRADFRAGMPLRTLDPAAEIAPLFARLQSIPELPHLRVWDESLANVPLTDMACV